MKFRHTFISLLLGAGTFSSALFGAAEAAPLVQNGKANAAIVLSADASAPEKFAAQEIQRYLKTITGAELPLRDKAGKGADIIVASLPAGSPGSPFKKGEDEETFTLRTAGEDVFITGNSPRAALYASYGWLQRHGVRFFAPNFAFYEGHSEFVPRRATLDQGKLDVTERPCFKYRRKYVEEGWSHTAKTLPHLLDWMAKNRHNVLVFPYNYQNAGHTRYDVRREQLLPELAKRGILVEVGGHGYQSFLPPEQYRPTRPEWFIAGHNVFNVANEEAVDTYVRNVIQYLKARPEIKIFDAWPPDGARWAPAVIEKFGSIANAEAYLTNRLSAAVEKELPGVAVETIAYTPAIDPPDAASMYSDKTFINFAVYGRSYRDTLDKSNYPLNVTFNNLIARWRANGFKGNVGVYEYYRKYAWHSLPVVLPKLYAHEIPHYLSQGANGLGTYSEPADWITYELTHALVAALSWNTRLDTEAWLTDYFAARYGKAAPALKEYVASLETAGRSLFHKAAAGDYGQQDAVDGARTAYQAAKVALDKGARLAPTGSSQAFLIQRLGWNLDYAQTSMEIAHHALRSERKSAQEQREKLEQLVEKHKLDGIILQHPTVVRRFRVGANTPEERRAVREQLATYYQEAWR